MNKVYPNPNDIAKFRRSNEWKLVVRSKKSADQIVKNIKRAEPSLNISLKEPAFVVAIKRVPEDLDELSLKQLFTKYTKTLKCASLEHLKATFRLELILTHF